MKRTEGRILLLKFFVQFSVQFGYSHGTGKSKIHLKKYIMFAFCLGYEKIKI